MYGFVTGGMGGLGQLRVRRRPGMGSFDPSNPAAWTSAQSADVQFAIPALMSQAGYGSSNASLSTLNTLLSNPNVSYVLTSGDLPDVERAALIQVVKRYNPSLSLAQIWSEIQTESAAGMDPSVATVTSALTGGTGATPVDLAQYGNIPVTPISSLSPAAQAGAALMAQVETAGDTNPVNVAQSQAFAQMQNQAAAAAAANPDVQAQQAAMNAAITSAVANATPADMIPSVTPAGVLQNRAMVAAPIVTAAGVPLATVDQITGNAISSPANPIITGSVATVPSWFTDSSQDLIPGVPNWALAAGGVVLLLLLKK